MQLIGEPWAVKLELARKESRSRGPRSPTGLLRIFLPSGFATSPYSLSLSKAREHEVRRCQMLCAPTRERLNARYWHAQERARHHCTSYPEEGCLIIGIPLDPYPTQDLMILLGIYQNIRLQEETGGRHAPAPQGPRLGRWHPAAPRAPT